MRVGLDKGREERQNKKGRKLEVGRRRRMGAGERTKEAESKR